MAKLLLLVSIISAYGTLTIGGVSVSATQRHVLAVDTAFRSINADIDQVCHALCVTPSKGGTIYTRSAIGRYWQRPEERGQAGDGTVSVGGDLARRGTAPRRRAAERERGHGGPAVKGGRPDGD